MAELLQANTYLVGYLVELVLPGALSL
jgi:hypothetical protein